MEYRLGDVKRVQLTIDRAMEGYDGTEKLAAGGISCFGCFCTSSSISSVSSICTAAQTIEDQEVLAAMVTLHDRAVAVLGEEGAAKALRSRAPSAIVR